MDDSYRQIIEHKIEEIISQTNFKSGDFDVNQIKDQIHHLTGAIPSIKIGWETIVMMKEGTNEEIKTDKCNSISIVWLDDEDKPHKVSYLL